ncbi:MAG: hypothetical protein Q4B85_12120 [Lachnospiraceae bacterium]|nr:hypothetical protein [Lachnospiraceae bacterium]
MNWFRKSRRILALFRVLRECERFRVKQETEEREERRELQKKRLEEWVPDRRKKNQAEEDSSGEQQNSSRKKKVAAALGNLLKSLFFSFGGCTALCLLLFLLGLFFGGMHPTVEHLQRGVQVVFTLSGCMLVLSHFSRARFLLYREINLPYIMTMPFTTGDLLKAKFLQLAGGVYRITAILVLPMWLGCSLMGGWNAAFTEAVFLGLLVLPGFVLIFLFSVICLGYTYVRVVSVKYPWRSRLLPLLAGGGAVLFLFILDMQTGGESGALLLELLWDLLPFNFILGQIVLGRQILGAVVLLLVNVLFWKLFFLLGQLFYQRSLLLRWDLRDDRKYNDFNSARIERVHTGFQALILREHRTVRGMLSYRITNGLSHIVFPLLLLLLFFLIEWITAGFGSGELNRPRHLTGLLFRYFLPLSLIPAWVNRAAATPFSRDAFTIECMLALPFDWKTQLRAKELYSIGLCGTGSLPGVLLLLAGLMGKRRIPIWSICPVLILWAGVTLWVADFRVMQDIRNVELDWKTPKELTLKKTSPTAGLTLLAAFLLPFLVGVVVELTALPVLIVLALTGIVLLAGCLLEHMQLFGEGLHQLKQLGRDVSRPKRTEWIRLSLKKLLSRDRKSIRESVKNGAENLYQRLRKK